jgi:hypothetical protein
VGAAPRVVGRQRPSSLWVPEFSASWGPEAVELAALAGLVADPWQAFVADGAMGVGEDGRWSAFEVGLEVARQNGKGGVIEIRELAGLYLLPERTLIHSAHEFSTSLEAFRRLLALIESAPDLDRLVMRVSRSHGEEGIELRDGSRILYRTRTKGGARGLTGDLVVLDEAMTIPAAVVAALVPLLRAVPNPQVWYCGSAVDQETMEHGLVFAGVRKRGAAGGEPSLAWYGWEAVNPATGEPFEHPEDVDEEAADDAGVWASANPALGGRVPLEHMEKERRAMPPRAFAVELLCVGDWPDPDPDANRKVPAAAWLACADRGSAPAPGSHVCFSFDVPPGRGSCAVAVAGWRADGAAHVEVAELRSGTGWVPERIAELVERHATLGVVVAKNAPAGSLVAKVETALESTSLPPDPKTGARVKVVETAEQARACGEFYDAVEQLSLRHLGTTELTAAVRGAQTRPLGDSWLWARRASQVNISPLVAVTNALWGLSRIEVPRPPVDLSRMRVRRF